MKQRYLVFPSGLAMSILLAGCQTDAVTAQLRNEGRPPAYIEGYLDGCKSGRFAAGDPDSKVARDTMRFNYDAQYIDGWNTGFSACKAKHQRSAR